MPKYTKRVESLPSTVPFVGPETQERARGASFQARLGANESVFGPSPKAIEAMAKAASEAWQYCDPENHDLKEALAANLGVSPRNIVVGEGIDGLLGNLVRLVCSDNTPIVTSLGAYPTFNFHVAGFGGELITVPYRDDKEDPEALVDATVRNKASLTYFANPDNPMGSWHDAETVNAMIQSMPQGALLCLDEAYGEFAPDGVLPSIDVSNDRVIRMRTFSKAHGMAGLRIGYAIAQEDLADAFNKIRNHFGVNRVAQAAGLAALADKEWLNHVKQSVKRSNRRIAEIAKVNGLNALPTATNFVTIDCGADGTFAKKMVAELIARDIFVRMPFVSPQDRCIRISAGTDADLDLLESRLPEALKAARAEA